ncbi:MAG: recombinase family protein, partial [Candidatus Eisenbacteria sp.]|nr:recombinase family protein [Candidatus Eisenbacteria bacterium]
QVKKRHLRRQEQRCRKYCARHRIKILRIFREEGYPGWTLDRPKLGEMLKFCSENAARVDIVLVFEVSRLSRDFDHHYRVRDELSRYDVRIRSVTEFIGGGVMGQLAERIAVVLAEWQKDCMSVRAKEGWARRRARENPDTAGNNGGKLGVNPKRRVRRSRDNPDFPLRGHLDCHVCDASMTGSRSTGRGGSYPYYFCGRGCPKTRVRKEEVEGGFLDLLDNLRLKAGKKKAWSAEITGELKRSPCEEWRRETILVCIRDRNPEWGWIWYLAPFRLKKYLQEALFPGGLSHRKGRFLMPEVCSDFEVPSMLAEVKPKPAAREQ